MAEFFDEAREQRRALVMSQDPRDPDWHDKPPQGFNAMGHPVPWSRRQAAYEHCKAMGLTDKTQATYTVDAMAQALERDEPYEAMRAGCTFLDLTGCYRLMAVLLVD